ncbi:MAG: M23 family metallopeptidase [Actinomycetota bacterium]|nr:M23 family metallopeptidase [Actinomycetota bacterium]
MPTTTSTTTTTTTTQPAPSPPPPRPFPPQPPPDPAGQDSVAEPVPTEKVVVPPPVAAQPVVPPAPELAEQQRREFDRAFAARAAEALRFEALLMETAALEARAVVVEADRRVREGRLLEAKERLKQLAVARYVATPVAPLNNALDAPDLMDMSRRFALLGALMQADRVRLDEYVLASRGVGEEAERVNADLTRSRAALAAARTALQQSDAAMVATKAQLVASQTGGIIVAGGLSFPVAGPHTFTDTFGAPRMFGTAFAHLHQGTDIFATEGTPLAAIERGVLIRVGSDTLGGTKLWLVGATGTRYYYAHLSAFAPGVTEGKVVQAGEVIGFVGRTGNAQGTSAHLHFEAHPDGGAAINPYPLLRIIDDAQRLVPGPLPGLPNR